MKLWFALAGLTAWMVVNAADPSAAPNRTEPNRAPAESPYAAWKNGPPTDDRYFPIAVWLQNPRNAARFKAAGINLYVGLWQGPKPEQLAALKAAGMPVICEQNEVGLQHKDNSIIVGWMHGDEPDNAQGIPGLRRWGPPVPPEKVVRDYERMRGADPTRPVFLNLGQGVAFDNYIGRGVRRNHPEDYPEYIKGSDIVSFDIYPVVHDSPQIAGKLEYVPYGVTRLIQWSGGKRVVWNCIECTHISNPPKKATPDQVRAEVWMALIHGSRGLIYFVHQFKPDFKEAALLEDPELLPAITAINRQIQELAPVLNSPSLRDGVTVQVSPQGTAQGPRSGAHASLPPIGTGPIAWMQKQHGGTVHLFAVNMRNEPMRGRFTVKRVGTTGSLQVLGESRQLSVRNGEFVDEFEPYQVHLYRGSPGATRP